MDTKESMQEQLNSKAAEDSDFRSRVIADPKGAIASEFDIELPDDLEIRVHEDDLTVANLVLPPTAKLTDLQLQAAAGGNSCAGGWNPW